MNFSEISASYVEYKIRKVSSHLEKTLTVMFVQLKQPKWNVWTLDCLNIWLHYDAAGKACFISSYHQQNSFCHFLEIQTVLVHDTICVLH